MSALEVSRMYEGHPDHHELGTEETEPQPQEKDHLVVLITGNLPGTGSSTLAENLARVLNLTPCSAGYFRRSIAGHYKVFHQSFRETKGIPASQPPTDQQIWSRFQELYFGHYQTLQLPTNPEGVTDRFTFLQTYSNNRSFSEADLNLFTTHQQLYGKDSSLFFDLIPDLLVYYTLSQPPQDTLGYVAEGKLSVLLDDLVAKLVPDGNASALAESGAAIIKFFLKVDPDISAKRVLKREFIKGNRKIDGFTTQQLLDWLDTDIAPEGSDPDQLKREVNLHLEAIKEMNLFRTRVDDNRFANVYGFPISRQTIENHDGLIVVDATQSQDIVLQAALAHITAEMTALAVHARSTALPLAVIEAIARYEQPT